MKQKSYSPVRTAQKTLRLLEVLGKEQPARPSELVKKLKLSRSNIHRLLDTLQEMGYVEKVSGARYRLGFKMFILGNTVLDGNELPDIARPYLIHLAEISHENVNLCIMQEQSVLYIDKIESPHYLKLDQPIGKTDPLHCTALGKILLSGLTDEALEAFLSGNKLVPNTKNTITDPEALAREIREVRKNGYAIDQEELAEGIHCIAAPIFDHTSKVIAAISLSAPSVRLTIRKIEELKAPLLEAAAEISKKLGSSMKGDNG